MYYFIALLCVAACVFSLNAADLQRPSADAATTGGSNIIGSDNQTNKDAKGQCTGGCKLAHKRKRRFIGDIMEYFKKAMTEAEHLKAHEKYEEKILKAARKHGVESFYKKMVEAKAKDKAEKKFNEFKKSLSENVMKFDSVEQKFKPKTDTLQTEHKHNLDSAEMKYKYEARTKLKPKSDSQEISEILNRYAEKPRDVLKAVASEKAKLANKLLNDEEVKKIFNKHMQETKSAINEYTQGLHNKLRTEAQERQTELKADKAIEDILTDYEKELQAKLDADAQLKKAESTFSGPKVDADLKLTKQSLNNMFKEHTLEIKGMLKKYAQELQENLRETQDKFKPQIKVVKLKIESPKTASDLKPKMGHDSVDRYEQVVKNSKAREDLEKLEKITSKQKIEMDTLMGLLKKVDDPNDKESINKLADALNNVDKIENRFNAARKVSASEKLAESIAEKNERFKKIRQELLAKKEVELRAEDVLSIHLTPKPDTALGSFLNVMRKDSAMAAKLKTDLMSRFPDVSSQEVVGVFEKLEDLRKTADNRVEQLKVMLPDLVPQADLNRLKEDLELVDNK